MTNELILLGGMTLVTFLIRYPLLAMSGHITLPPRLLQALNYIPPAILTAIVVPAVLLDGDSLWVDFNNARLMGALVALAVSLWKKNLLLTILVGMGVFWLWQTFLG